MHAGALALGLWLLVTGRQPAWMRRVGKAPLSGTGPGGWQRISGPVRTAAAGTAWVALPCGLLQSALVVAALADGPLQGAATMTAFAIASSIGLSIVPAFAWRHGPAAIATRVSSAWAVRAAGGALALASSWALGHGLWQRVAAWCAAG